MSKSLIVVALIILSSAQSFSQKVVLKVTMGNKEADAKNDTIYYSEKRPLTWDDFKGTPDYNSVGGAVTSSGFAFNANMNMNANTVYLNVNVFAFFSKKHSWKKPNINSDYHLLHEQHHFDITRICAQKFYDELLKANFTLNNYNELMTSIFNKAFDENNELQKQYDSETNHSINTKAQLEWNDRIEKAVKKLPVAANL
jgi:hypothetical protein